MANQRLDRVVLWPYGGRARAGVAVSAIEGWPQRTRLVRSCGILREASKVEMDKDLEGEKAPLNYDSDDDIGGLEHRQQTHQPGGLYVDGDAPPRSDGEMEEGVPKLSEPQGTNCSLVVDWQSTPDRKVARDYNLLHRPAYVMKGHTHKVPVDRVRLPTTVQGWLIADSEEAPVKPYGLLSTTNDDVSKIGGVGMRQYYLILQSLPVLFLLLGAISTPSLVVYSNSTMFEHTAAQRFADTPGVEQTPGNIVGSPEKIADGQISELWVNSATNAAVATCIIAYTLWIGKKLSKLTNNLDLQMIGLSDYTVKIQPCGTVWDEYRVTGNKLQTEQEAEIKQAIEDKVQAELGTIAELDGHRCIRIAFDQNEQIALWRKKHTLLVKLEQAFSNCWRAQHAEHQRGALALLAELEALNSYLININDFELSMERHEWVPLCAFVTFEQEEAYNKALAKQRIEIGKTTCSIAQAPVRTNLVQSSC